MLEKLGRGHFGLYFKGERVRLIENLSINGLLRRVRRFERIRRLHGSNSNAVTNSLQYGLGHDYYFSRNQYPKVGVNRILLLRHAMLRVTRSHVGLNRQIAC